MNAAVAKTPKLLLTILAVAAVALLIAGGVFALTQTLWRDGGAEIGQENAADDQDTLAAKAAITARSPMAQSMSYDGVFTHWTGSLVAVCGRVDIIEEEDSFEGPERFVYSDGELTLEEADGSDVVAQKWDDLCK